MLFKLIKELPWMFVIALIIWLIVLLFIIKNIKKKETSFFKKHKTSFIVVLMALIITVFDIWLFVQFIPTHFRKNNTTPEQTLSVNDITKELQITDTLKKITVPSKSKDSSSTKKIDSIKPAARIYSTNKASIHFFSSTTAEDIEATNNNVASALNTQTGDLRFIALIKGFYFDNEMMQDHFNDKDYMNSEAFPKSEFKGTITNIKAIDFTKDGNYNVTVTGNLSIHGITQKIIATGTLTINNKKPSIKSIFKIKRVDFGITTDEIADTIEITVISKYY